MNNQSKPWPGSGAKYDEDPNAIPFPKGAAFIEPFVLTTNDPDARIEPVWPADSFQKVFADIFQEAFDLLVERQRKYGPNNIRELGLFGVFQRMQKDKIERIKRSFNGRVEHGDIVLDEIEDFSDESWEDAVKDVANYALIMLALKRGLWGRPLA